MTKFDQVKAFIVQFKTGEIIDSVRYFSGSPEVAERWFWFEHQKDKFEIIDITHDQVFDV